MIELEKLKDIFLNDEDPETVEENRKLIAEWEQGLIKNRARAEWQDHDITRELSKQARKTYIDIAIALSQNRKLSPFEREAMYAKQDAMAFILYLTEKDAKGEISQIEGEIKRALNST